MKTTKAVDSDVTARKQTERPDTFQEESDARERESSNKSGKHSAVEKLNASRPELGPSPGGNPVPGAFGNPEEDDAEHAPHGGHRDKALRSK